MKPRTTMVFGTFDLLHPGHEFFLNFAKRQGKHLTVVIGRDATVERLKGRKPLQSERMRKKVVKALGIADNVLLGDLKDHLKRIREEKPDIIVLGYDQTHFTEKLEADLKSIGLEKTKIIRAPAFRPEKWKSSKLRNAIRSSSVNQTKTIASNLTKQVRRGDVYLLRGPVGAGKTVFVQGFLAALGIRETITSPTYIYELTYASERFTIHHLDLYRINEPEKLITLGIEERLRDQESVALVEWPEIWEHAYPMPHSRRIIAVDIDVMENNERQIRITDTSKKEDV